MAASNPSGEMQFWWNGFPFVGVKNGTKDAGEMQFWWNGFPFVSQFPYVSPGAQIKTINGLALASIKTRNGLAIASVKKINGALTQ